jgi:hypothetical protein
MHMLLNRARRVKVPLLLLLAVAPQIWPQIQPGGKPQDDIFSFIGLKLDDLVMRFGVPKTVHAQRGAQEWQDDVVFIYDEGEFYIFRDRVWQIGLKSAYGIKIGDAKAIALTVLGEKAQDEGDYVLCPLPGAGWPLSLRANFTANKIMAIFIYRPDF